MKSLTLNKTIIVTYGRRFLDQPYMTVIESGSIIKCRSIDGVLYGVLPGGKPLKYLSKNPKCIWLSKIPREAIDIGSISKDLKEYFIDGENNIAPFPCFAKDQGLHKVKMFPDCSFVDYYNDSCRLKKEALISKDDLAIQDLVDDVLRGRTLIAFRRISEMGVGLIGPLTSVRAIVGFYEVGTPHKDIQRGKSYYIIDIADLYSWRGYGGKIIDIQRNDDNTVIRYYEITDFNRMSDKIKILTLNSNILLIEKKHDTLIESILQIGLIAKIVCV
ncbi:MAG: hypothetical protein HDS75_01750 [Bacteroidales bacterium]|nr:hypothetical protein [Bacteroidales bacterium]